MHWLVLAISIVFEVIATSSMKYASISKNNLYLIVFAVFFFIFFSRFILCFEKN
ncbi:SMR family transporter [Campylobacter lari]|nr:SMR family transporter [Campylobacter lari]HEC1754149.1 hypothetical protein [Campylobacter lari]